MGIESEHTERLLQAAEHGDAVALGRLIDLHRDYLRRVVDLRIDRALRGRVDPSDVVQETQIAATQRIADFIERRPTSFKLWLRGEAMQQIVAQRRRHVAAARRSVDRECSISNVSSLLIARNLLHGTPSEAVERKELAERVRQLMENMPEKDREILTLRYVEELTNTEAAEVLKIHAAAARKRHGRAMKRLLEMIVESGLADPNEMSRR